MSMQSDSSLDETIKMRAPSAAEGETQKVDQASTAQEETVRINPPAQAGLQAAQPEPGNETQPTVRVNVPPMSETQPTMPVAKPPRDEQPTIVSPKARPVAPPASTEPKPFIRRGTGINLPPISGWMLIAAGGIAVLLILFGVALLLSTSKGGLFASNTPTPTATLTPTATQTPLPTATVPPTNTPVPVTPTPVIPVATPRPDPTELGIGVLAKVTPPEGLKLKVRDQAGTGGQVLGELDAGAQVKIVDGPTDANNLKWWKVDNGQGLVGWSAEGSGGDTYLVPVGWAP
jgi:hypothetical protein